MFREGCPCVCGYFIYFHTAVWRTSCAASVSIEACVLKSYLEHVALRIWRVSGRRIKANEDQEEICSSVGTLWSKYGYFRVSSKAQTWVADLPQLLHFRVQALLMASLLCRNQLSLFPWSRWQFPRSFFSILSSSWPLRVLFCAQRCRQPAGEPAADWGNSSGCELPSVT